ncbi:MAG: dioxygenase [Acidobacteria bacterium]|nr:dioxygenase [Acidobacteriota bacterium]
MDREAVVAGQFYPGNAAALRQTIESYISKPESLMEAQAVVVPHAGYMYSGAVAGEVFSSISLPRRVILLGPNHTGRGASLALSPSGAWRLPLGKAWIDDAMNRSLLVECPDLQEDSSAHRSEHSLEVQIPFLQVLQPDFRFSAIVVRTIDYSLLEDLGHAMARVIQSLKEPVLLVASSDMTHYVTAKEAAKQDQLAIDRILAMDPEGLHRVVLEKDISMCGFAPTVAVLVACGDLGASKGRLIRYTNSGTASGDFDHVVAYAGIAIGGC